MTILSSISTLCENARGERTCIFIVLLPYRSRVFKYVQQKSDQVLFALESM